MWRVLNLIIIWGEVQDVSETGRRNVLLESSFTILISTFLTNPNPTCTGECFYYIAYGPLIYFYLAVFKYHSVPLVKIPLFQTLLERSFSSNPTCGGEGALISCLRRVAGVRISGESGSIDAGTNGWAFSIELHAMNVVKTSWVSFENPSTHWLHCEWA